MHISSSDVGGGNAFAAEQKIREFKKLLFTTKSLDKKNYNQIHANELLTKATNNLSRNKSVKTMQFLEELKQKVSQIFVDYKK